MANRQYESMTRAVCAGFTVRVWGTERALKSGPREDVLTALHGVDIAFMEAEHDPLPETLVGDISRVIDALPDVAAYEILSENGCGCVVYPDWK